MPSLRLPILLSSLLLWPGSITLVRGESSPTFFSQSWQTEEGLPDNAVNDIAQTPDGYLWLATLKGLVRFDGLRFVVFTSGVAPGLRSAQVRRLKTSRDGTLWISAGSGGINALRQGRFQSYAYPPGFEREEGTALGEAPEGSVWCATRTTPVFRFADGKVSAFPREGSEISNLNDWIATSDGSLDLLSATSIYATRDGAFSRIWSTNEKTLCATPRAAGGHWLAAGRFLYLYNDRTVGDAVATLPEPIPVRTMLEDRSGALWIGTADAGLLRFSQGRFTHVPTSHPSIRALFEDREGNLWAGTAGGGVNKIRERQFQLRDRETGLPAEVVHSLCEDQQGAIWCITQGGAVCRWGRGEESATILPAGLVAKAVAICASSDGSIWIGTDGEGLVRLENGRTTTFRVKDGLTSDFVTMLEPAAGGGVLAGTVQGLSCFTGESLEVVAGPGVLGEGVRAIAEDRANRLWVASGDGALHCFTGRAHRTFGVAEGMPGEVIRCLLATDDGSLWIGTDGGGLCRWRDGKITRWTRRDGLWEDVITQIQVDASGDFWCGSPRGLFRVHFQQLENPATGSQPGVISTHFGRSDGLANFTFASEFHPRSWRLRDHRLLFATQKGVVEVDRSKLRQNRVAPNLLIEGIRVNDWPQELEPDRGSANLMLIGPGVRSLEFTFSAPSLTAPDKVRVRYRMEGLDAEWREAHAARSVTYNHLSPGNYRFRVIGSNGEGIWNETGVVQAFTVRTYVWQERWFLAIALLVFAAGIAALARWWSLLRVRR